MLMAGAILCLMVPFGAASAAAAVFKLRVRNDVNTAIEIGNGLLWGAAVVAIAAADGGLVAFAWAFFAANAVTTIVQIVLALRQMPPRLRGTRRHWGSLMRIGLPVGISGLLIVAYGRIDQILVFRIVGDEAAGLYGSVYRVLDRAEFVPAAIMTTLYPIIAAAHGVDPARVRRLVQVALDALSLITLPLLAFTIAMAAPIVDLLFGDEFAAAAPALPILMGAFVLVAYNYLVGYMIIVLELQRRFVVYAVGALVFNVAANLVLLPPYGFLAAAWITLATELLVFGLAMRDVLARFELRPKLARISRLAVAAAAMGAVVWGLRQAGLPFGVLCAVAALSYPVGVLALRAASREEITALIARRGL
jgi:O-antigen/teichoic acid export membrane protein